ncbi:MAG: hypothetical protein IPG18_02000 [Saprospiraceae bacterium]|nr:hypothetical protein [Saprospiraceae bacterium]MBK8373041.1 hypothetical protein [Saprospiraceae bacterium]
MKNSKTLVFFAFFFIFINLVFFQHCTPKVAEEMTLPKEEKEEVVTNNNPKSVCSTFDDLNGADKENATTAYVLYKDFIKANRYEEALPIWRTAYTLAPASNGRVKYQFDDGIKIYKYLIEKTTDEAQKKKYVDTIYQIYDKRIYCFGDEAYVNGLKAFDGYYSFQRYFDTTTVYNWFTSHIDSKGKHSEYFIVNPFSKMLYDGVVSGKIDKKQGLHYAKMVGKIVEHGLKTCKEAQCATWEIINSYAPVQLELLEGIENFYDCEYYVDKYIPLFHAYPDSCEIVNTAFGRLSSGGCDPKGKELTELAKVKSKKCYTAPESPGLARLGYDEYQKGNYKKAIQYFENFAQESKDNETKAKYYLLVAKIYYGDIKNFSKSRSYARKSAEYKNKWGEPYLLIGKLYASSGPLCGPGTGWDSQIVTWVAVDQFQYARSIDPASAAEANKLIAQYSKFMPNSEDLFFRNIKKGSTYFVPCWIQEETKVRTSD